MLSGPYKVLKCYALKWSKTANLFNKLLCTAKTALPSKLIKFFV